jgi:hypothetical protein
MSNKVAEQAAYSRGYNDCSAHFERIAVEVHQRHWAEIERLRGALEKIANGDPSRVYSPIGPLHAAGMVLQWEQDAAIARAALDGAADQPAPARNCPDCGGPDGMHSYACDTVAADKPPACQHDPFRPKSTLAVENGSRICCVECGANSASDKGESAPEAPEAGA